MRDAIISPTFRKKIRHNREVALFLVALIGGGMAGLFVLLVTLG